MWDGSAVDMTENMKVAKEMLAMSVAAKTVLEIEIGVVGGEEDGIEAKHDAKLYSTPEDALLTIETLGTDANARYMVAATFGNVHGVYKPGNVVSAAKDSCNIARSGFKEAWLTCRKQANGLGIPPVVLAHSFLKSVNHLITVSLR
jgi:fructose/tagatose bisphosphate aldolase